MVKLNKIYTKIGDKGSTQLGDGKMVNKDSLRVDAYGSVDEANATIGLSILRTNIKIKKILKIVQNDLFDLGADLCIPDKKNTQKLKITKDRVDYIEEKIDNFNKELSSLNSFILPGGSESSTYLHIARTVTRRAERKIVALSKKEKINTFLFFKFKFILLNPFFYFSQTFFYFYNVVSIIFCSRSL